MKKGSVARLPKRKEDVSGNWKNLQKQIAPSSKRRRKIESAPVRLMHADAPAPKPDIWFDDVDECLLDPQDLPNRTEPSVSEAVTSNSLVKHRSFPGLTKIIALDCEMVGVGPGGCESVLARVSIVNHFGNCLYDKYVKPSEKVTDYRTQFSGIRPGDLEKGEAFSVVQKEVSDLMANRILVGHALKNDLKVLFLTHPKRMIRDTSCYKYFRSRFGGKVPSLKRLCETFLGVQVQQGEHNSVQDAQAAMRLYTMFRKEWEKQTTARKPMKARRRPASPKASHPEYSDSE